MRSIVKTILPLILSIAATSILQAQSILDTERLVNATAAESDMRHGTLSVCVYNISTGQTVYSYNPDISMIPASVQKLFTTGAGFALLGSNFRFQTELKMRGTIDREGVLHGNIYIFGGGDPLLGSYRYRQTSPDSLFDCWASAIRKKGIRRIDGHICYNTSIFDDNPIHDSWQWGDIGNYYAAGVNGLNFHENMYFVYFNAGDRVGAPATVSSTKPKNLDLRGSAHVSTGPVGSGDQVNIYGTPSSAERTYKGTVPLGARAFAVRGAMPEPARTCADMFASYLRTNGIGISSSSEPDNTTPDSLRQLITFYSTDYYTIAQYTNLTSNNIYAECIFKYLGFQQYGLGSFKNGAKVLTTHFYNLGLNTAGVNIEDGSGLSRLNLTTASFICQYLKAISGESFFDDFRQSMAKVGQNGTARNMLPNLPENISISIKTGTMKGVKAYAGYITARNGNLLSFAIIANNFSCSETVVKEKMDNILFKIATLY